MCFTPSITALLLLRGRRGRRLAPKVGHPLQRLRLRRRRQRRRERCVLPCHCCRQQTLMHLRELLSHNRRRVHHGRGGDLPRRLLQRRLRVLRVHEVRPRQVPLTDRICHRRGP